MNALQLSELTAISPLDGRYGKKTQSLRGVCSEWGLIRWRVKVEVEWLKALTLLPEIGPLHQTEQVALAEIVDNFSLADAEAIKDLERETNHDVKAVEYFLKKQLAKIEDGRLCEWVHFGCTSEDINNLAYALMLQTLCDQHALPLMNQLVDRLRAMAQEFAAQPMLSRTHGQPATPTTMGKELANFVYRLEAIVARVQSLPLSAKCNGAVGNFNAHQVAYPEINWPHVAKTLVESLGLVYHPYTTQIEPHDYIAALAHAINEFNTVLIGLAQDCWGYISRGYFRQKVKANEVGSSTMPHKVNPIDFENAEGNLGLSNALLQYFANKLPISRFQRDLSDSTVLRNVGMSLAYAFLAYEALLTGLAKLNLDSEVLHGELDQHWEVLAEPIQTVMRQHGLAAPYEQLKQLTRGQRITKNILHDFINSLHLPAEVKATLLSLTPATYVGFAEILARKI